MKPATEDPSFTCPTCSEAFYERSNRDQHVCARVAPRGAAFHSDSVVTDTGPSWIGRPIPGTRWREE